MKQGHRLGECGLKKSCVYCHQWNNHHRSLCQQKFGAENREGANLVQELHADENYSINENALLSSGEMVLMQTATADISNPNSKQMQNVRLLFDTGSHRTYITESLAKRLNLKRGEESEINLVTFGSEKPQTQKTAETTIGILLKRWKHNEHQCQCRAKHYRIHIKTPGPVQIHTELGTFVE